MTTIEKKSLRVGKYVDTNHVDSLVRTYKQERWKYNSERMGKEDSLALYYSVDELQEFLQRSKEAGADRIMIHFGVYPQNYNERPGYAGMQTIVFVATECQETETGCVYKNIKVDTDKGPSILAYNTSGLPFGKGASGDSDDWAGIGTTLVDMKDGVKLV